MAMMAESTDTKANAQQPRQPKFIAVGHQKGGIGKTTTVCNLAASIAHAGTGLRVVVIDLDPQGAASRLLGENDELAPIGAYDVIVTGEIGQGAIQTTKITNCLLLPATEQLVAPDADEAMRSLSNEDVRKQLVKNLAGTDLVIIDSPSGLGINASLAMSIADTIIMPTPPHVAEVRALRQTIEHVKRLRSDAEDIILTLITMSDTRNQAQATIISDLQDELGDMLSAISVPQDPAIGDAALVDALLFDNNKNAPAAKAYRELATEISSRLGLGMPKPVQAESVDAPADDDLKEASPDHTDPDVEAIPESLRTPPSEPDAPSSDTPSDTSSDTAADDTSDEIPDDTSDETHEPNITEAAAEDKSDAQRKLGRALKFILVFCLLAVSGVGTFFVLLDPANLDWVLGAIGVLIGGFIAGRFFKLL
jgi:chromosome partitioning protein